MAALSRDLQPEKSADQPGFDALHRGMPFVVSIGLRRDHCMHEARPLHACDVTRASLQLCNDMLQK